MNSQGDPPDERRSLVSSGLATFGANVAAAALGLVNVFITARALGPVGRGEVALLTTIGFLTSQAASIGVDQANLNFGGSHPDLRRSLATNSVLIAVVAGLAAVGLVALITTLVPSAGGDVKASLRWLVLASIPALIASFYLRNLAIAAYGFASNNAAYVIPPVVNVTVNGVLALSGVLSVTTAVIAWIAGQLLSGVFLTVFVIRRLGGFGRPDWALAKRQTRFGLKAHGGRVMLLGNYRVDQWILSGISGSRELGIYSVAVSWAEALFFLPQALSTVQRPDLVRGDDDDAARNAAIVFRAATVVTAALAIGLIAFAPLLCVTLFGEQYRDSVGELRLLTLGGFGIAALKMLGSALTARGRPLLETASIGLSFVAILALDVILIPAHGGTGAAVASTVSYSIGGVAVVVIFARALGAPLRTLVPRPSDVTWLIRRARAALATRSGLR